MTPSEAHDSAWQRDAGHDEMQLEVMRDFGANLRSVKRKDRYGSAVREFGLYSCTAERMFCCKSGRRFFADIAMEFTHSEKQSNGALYSRSHFIILEIKPVIHSAGAVLRQIAMLQQNMKEWVSSSPHGGSWDATYDVAAVVRADDPKVQLLAELGQTFVFAWDGKRIGKVRPA